MNQATAVIRKLFELPCLMQKRDHFFSNEDFAELTEPVNSYLEGASPE